MQGDALRALLQDEVIASDVQCSQLVAHAALQIAGVSTDAFPARPVRNFSMVYVQVPVHPNQPPQVGGLPGWCPAPAVMLPSERQALEVQLSPVRTACPQQGGPCSSVRAVIFICWASS